MLESPPPQQFVAFSRQCDHHFVHFLYFWKSPEYLIRVGTLHYSLQSLKSLGKKSYKFADLIKVTCRHLMNEKEAVFRVVVNILHVEQGAIDLLCRRLRLNCAVQQIILAAKVLIDPFGQSSITFEQFRKSIHHQIAMNIFHLDCSLVAQVDLELDKGTLAANILYEVVHSIGSDILNVLLMQKIAGHVVGLLQMVFYYRNTVNLNNGYLWISCLISQWHLNVLVAFNLFHLDNPIIAQVDLEHKIIVMAIIVPDHIDGASRVCFLGLLAASVVAGQVVGPLQVVFNTLSI